MTTTQKQLRKLILKNEQEMRVISIDELIAVSVTDYLCRFETESLKDFVCSKALCEVEKLLPKNFIRIHRNVIINSDKIIGFNKKNRKICLENNIEHVVSVRNVKKIIITLTQ